MHHLLACIPLLITLVIAKSYRLKRILTFLDPWEDAQGAGFPNYSIIDCDWLGWPLWRWHWAIQTKFFYLPMQHTDFIFSIIAEETGLMGAEQQSLRFIYYFYILAFALHWNLTHLFSLLDTGLIIVISRKRLLIFAWPQVWLPQKESGYHLSVMETLHWCANFIMIGLIVF